MLLFINLFILFIFFCGLLSFCSIRKHLLSTLLRLEFIVLRMFFLLFNFLSLFSIEVYFSMFFLTFCVCEGVLGLSILVSLIRSHGNDFFNSFSILQC